MKVKTGIMIKSMNLIQKKFTNKRWAALKRWTHLCLVRPERSRRVETECNPCLWLTGKKVWNVRTVYMWDTVLPVWSSICLASIRKILYIPVRCAHLSVSGIGNTISTWNRISKARPINARTVTTAVTEFNSYFRTACDTQMSGPSSVSYAHSSREPKAIWLFTCESTPERSPTPARSAVALSPWRTLWTSTWPHIVTIDPICVTVVVSPQNISRICCRTSESIRAMSSTVTRKAVPILLLGGLNWPHTLEVICRFGRTYAPLVVERSSRRVTWLDTKEFIWTKSHSNASNANTAALGGTNWKNTSWNTTPEIIPKKVLISHGSLADKLLSVNRKPII